jgi:hypothetical protein
VHEDHRRVPAWRCRRVGEEQARGEAGNEKANVEKNDVLDRSQIRVFGWRVAKGCEEDLAENGDAGDVSVNIAGQISILNAGDIATSTFSKGSGGNIDVVAGSMLIDSRGITGFVGGGTHPVPLSADEVNQILYRQASSAERPRNTL